MKRLVVLDTNCLVQMLSVHSSYRPAWQAFREGKYELCVTNEILEEYQGMLIPGSWKKFLFPKYMSSGSNGL